MRTMHENSLEAYRSLNVGERCALVLAAYVDAGQPITDRQCMRILGFNEPNTVRPRINRLVKGVLLEDGTYFDGGYLREVGSVKCEETGRMVRLCEITEKVNP